MTKLKLAAVAMIMIVSDTLGNAQISTGQIIFNVPGEPCTGSIKAKTWVAPYAMKIAQIQIFNGLDFGQASDVIENVSRVSNGVVDMVINANHDDYVNGGPVRLQTESWGGNYFPLAAGDQLVFQYMCSNINVNGHGAWNVTIWTLP